MVLKVADFRVSKTFAKTLRRFVRAAGNEVRIDRAFGSTGPRSSTSRSGCSS
jgi:hypothetical protein